MSRMRFACGTVQICRVNHMDRLRPLGLILLCASILILAQLTVACSATPAGQVSPVTSAAPAASAVNQAPTQYSYKVIKVYPHDTKAFTEGLVMDQGVLYEGTGLKGSSSLRRVDLETGKVLQSLSLPEEYFGE